MMNFVKKVTAFVMAVYGSLFTTIIVYQILIDDLYVSSRPEGLVMMTCLPTMVIGFRTLKKIWTYEALSRESKIIRVVASDEEAA